MAREKHVICESCGNPMSNDPAKQHGASRSYTDDDGNLVVESVTHPDGETYVSVRTPEQVALFKQWWCEWKAGLHDAR